MTPKTDGANDKPRHPAPLAHAREKNDRVLKKIADVMTKRGPYREMRNQITTALLNLAGNGLTWVRASESYIQFR
jgi:hypothetical protein